MLFYYKNIIINDIEFNNSWIISIDLIIEYFNDHEFFKTFYIIIIFYNVFIIKENWENIINRVKKTINNILII